MLELRIAELGDHGQQAQLVDRRPVDPADERPGQPLHEGIAEPPAEERPDGDVHLETVAGEDEVETHPQLLEGREEVGRDERAHPRREDQAHPVGQSAEAAAAPDVDGPRLGRPDDRLAQAELAGQLEGRRPVADERVRPGLDEEAVLSFRADLAAQPRARLGEDDGDPRPTQLVGRGQAGDPTADDEDGHGSTTQTAGTAAVGGSAAIGGTYGQSGSVSSGSPVQAKARAREPPHRRAYSQRPQRPL